MTQKTYLIKALIVDAATGQGLPDLHVRAYDKDPVWDDCLGSDNTDAHGACTIRFFERDFRELFEGEPEVYLVIYDDGNRQLHRTEPVRLKREQTTLELRVPISTPRPATAIRISVAEPPTPDANSLRVLISIDERALQITRTPFGTRVELPGFYTAGEEGGPGLPAHTFQIALPRLARATRIEARARQTKLVDSGPVAVMPVQPRRPGVRDADSILRSKQRERSPLPYFSRPKWIAPRAELYRRAIEEPRPLTRELGSDFVGAVPVISIELNPVRMLRDASLEMDTEFEVIVHFEDMGHVGEMSRTLNEIGVFSRAQAWNLTEMARAIVVNPGMVLDYSGLLVDEEVTYLIITDDKFWSEKPIAAGAATSGSLVAAFERLADWKKKRGYKARVVTVSDIVDGKIHGTSALVTGAPRDLQEVIRNFLKWAYKEWGICYVLLGGDTQIIPVRSVCGALEAHVVMQQTDPPITNTSFWTGSFLKIKLNIEDYWGWPGNIDIKLVDPFTGQLIPFDAAGNSGPNKLGWFYTTDNTYTTRSVDPTGFVRVNGSASKVKGTLQWLYQFNVLPTDLYYSSLVGKEYNAPGKHDWDSLDNGLYGQHYSAGVLDDFHFVPQVALGRAPVSSAAEADNFVDKVIAYEQCRKPDGTPLDAEVWLPRIVIASSNWDKAFEVTATATNPPEAGRYFHAPGAGHTTIHVSDTPGIESWRLMTVVDEADVREIPFDPNVKAGGRGWYYSVTKTEVDPTEPGAVMVVETELWNFSIKFYIITETVTVFGWPEELEPLAFYFTPKGIDGSLLDQEILRKQLAADLSDFKKVTRLYMDDTELLDAGDSGNPPLLHLSPDTLGDALNAGPHFVSLSGHGNSGGCCHLSTGLAQGLTNGYRTFIGYADSCLTNMFDVDGDDSMSEWLINNPNGGAVGYIGNTRYSWVGLGDEFQRAFFERLMSIRHLGMLNDSRYSIAYKSGCDVYSKWSCFTLNLLGDPEMPVWREMPRPLEVQFKPLMKVSEPLVVNIASSGKPLSGVGVHLQRDAFTRFAKTDQDGKVTFKVSKAPVGNYELVVTKIGYLPIFEQIQIVA